MEWLKQSFKKNLRIDWNCKMCYEYRRQKESWKKNFTKPSRKNRPNFSNLVGSRRWLAV